MRRIMFIAAAVIGLASCGHPHHVQAEDEAIVCIQHQDGTIEHAALWKADVGERWWNCG